MMHRILETLWWLLKQLYEKDMLYKGHTIQPYSPAAGTGLSSHELNMPGTYKDVKDTSITAQFKIEGAENDYFLAWTTTPWTLPGNSALAVHEYINYVKVRTFNQYTFEPVNVILAKDRMEALGASFVRTGELTVFTLNSIKKMVMGLISPKNLSGPITIAKVATASAKSGLESYISFLALLSVSLGVLNLLPIPVLDGGHLMFYTAELLAGRPVPEKIQALGYQVGLFLVLGIMMLALYNDFARL